LPTFAFSAFVVSHCDLLRVNFAVSHDLALWALGDLVAKKQLKNLGAGKSVAIYV
jgi:hypothetical protein